MLYLFYDNCFSNHCFNILAIIHEYMHGFAAYRLGDNTAKNAGRLTINPLAHLDLFGSFIAGDDDFSYLGFVIGWAKPVPYNPYNLRDKNTGKPRLSLAGPLSNLAIFDFWLNS